MWRWPGDGLGGLAGQLALLWMEVLAVGGDKRVRIGTTVVSVKDLVPVLRPVNHGYVCSLPPPFLPPLLSAPAQAAAAPDSRGGGG